jgi:hypothetical protein
MLRERRGSRLNLDPSGLGGTSYFKLAARLRQDLTSEHEFIKLVVAELNPPITPEDVMKIPFADLNIISMRVMAFTYKPRS